MKKENNNKGIRSLFKRVMRKVFGTGWVRPDYIEQKVFECEKCEAELLMDPKELSKDLNGGCDFCTEVEPKAKKKSAKRKTTKKKTTKKSTKKKAGKKKTATKKKD
jgi:hypothetical protein